MRVSILMDRDYALQLLEHGYKFARYDGYLSAFRLHQDNKSGVGRLFRVRRPKPSAVSRSVNESAIPTEASLLDKRVDATPQRVVSFSLDTSRCSIAARLIAREVEEFESRRCCAVLSQMDPCVGPATLERGIQA